MLTNSQISKVVCASLALILLGFTLGYYVGNPQPLQSQPSIISVLDMDGNTVCQTTTDRCQMETREPMSMFGSVPIYDNHVVVDAQRNNVVPDTNGDSYTAIHVLLKRIDTLEKQNKSLLSTQVHTSENANRYSDVVASHPLGSIATDEIRTLNGIPYDNKAPLGTVIVGDCGSGTHPICMDHFDTLMPVLVQPQGLLLIGVEGVDGKAHKVIADRDGNLKVKYDN